MRISDWSSDVCSSDLGNGADDPRSDLTRTLHASLPADRFTTIGHQENVAHWMPAIDIFALSSGWGEGFPNVIGEAMACGNPCVATDVGDARWIIGQNGGIVPPGEPEALADALIALYRSEEHTSELQSLMRLSYAVF